MMTDHFMWLQLLKVLPHIGKPELPTIGEIQNNKTNDN